MVPRQQAVDPALLVTDNERLESAGQEGLRVDSIELARLDQRRDRRPVLSSCIVSGGERVQPMENDRTDGPFDTLVVELDADVGEEEAEAQILPNNVGLFGYNEHVRKVESFMILL
jgi:hypothetical protein